MLTKTLKYLGMLVLMLPVWAGAQTAPPVTLAVIPLTVHAGQDLSYLAGGVADMLASRIAAGTELTVLDGSTVRQAATALEQPLDQAAARAIGQTLGADYVLFGSITRLGRRFSLDLTLLDISGGNSPASFFGQADDEDGLIPAVDALAEKIQRSLSGRSSASATLPPPADIASAEKMPPAASQGSVNLPPTPTRQGPSHFRKVHSFDMEARGLAVADIDADGNNEIMVLSSGNLDIRRMENKALKPVATYAAGPGQLLLTVDAADTDGNGRAEIFVTCRHQTSSRLCSFVLSVSDQGIEIIAENQNWYFRSTGDGRVFGQKQGLSDAFLPGIWRLEKKGDEYTEQEKITVPDDFSVFSFSTGDVTNDGRLDGVALDNDDRFRIYDRKGAVLWKGSEPVGGSETPLAEANREKAPATAAGRLFLPQRVFVADINADGQNEVLTVSNQALGGRLFERYRRFKQTALICFVWDGLGLTEQWRTPVVSGYAADFTLADIDNDGKNELAAVIVTSRKSIFSRPESVLIAYETELVEK